MSATRHYVQLYSKPFAEKQRTTVKNLRIIKERGTPLVRHCLGGLQKSEIAL